MSRHLSGVTLGIISLVKTSEERCDSPPEKNKKKDYPGSGKTRRIKSSPSLSPDSSVNLKGGSLPSKRTDKDSFWSRPEIVSVGEFQPVSGNFRKIRSSSRLSGIKMVVGGEFQTDLEVKIILLGDYSVGKSSLLRVLSRSQLMDVDDNGNSTAVTSNSPLTSTSRSSGSGRSSERRQSTTRGPLIRSKLQPGGFVEVEFTHQEKTVLARIADTGGQERYRSMTTSYYRGAHGCLLMFDVTKEESFDNLDSWIENVDTYKTCDEFSCIVVGTRCKSPARRVSYERAAEFADNRGLPYLELDMDHMTDVRRVFGVLLDSVTVNLNRKLAPIAINIKPDIGGKGMFFPKNVACSC